MTAERVLMAVLIGGVAAGCVLVLYPFFSAVTVGGDPGLHHLAGSGMAPAQIAAGTQR